MPDHRYALAPQGVFRTIQGEGTLLGLPMVFVRLAGCSVGCPGCDTDYSVASRVSLADLVSRISSHAHHQRDWVWITGGEPTDQDIAPLVAALRGCNWSPRIALATAGVRKVQRGSKCGGVDFLSVSPHRTDFVQRTGDQVNLVPGLNGLRLVDLAPVADEMQANFSACYVTPCEGKPETSLECQEWLRARPMWRLGIQAHKSWGMP